MRSAYSLLFVICFNLNASENLSDHEQFCQHAKITDCSTYLNEQLLAQLPHSHSWFRIKAFQLDYMYDQHQFSTLQAESESLLQLELPEVLKVQVYFYYAKTLFISGQVEAAKTYANKTISLLEDVYSAFGNPLRIIELANLYYSLGEYTQAENLLNNVEKTYQKSKDALFLFELNSNKALIRHQQNKLEEAAEFRAEALKAALTLAHNHKIIIAMGNLARTKQLLGQLTTAQELYEQSLVYTAKPDYQVQHNIHLVRLTEICLQLNQATEAQHFYEQISPALLGPGHRTIYDNLATALAIAAKK